MEQQKALKTLRPQSVLIPLFLAVGLIAWLVYQDENITAESFSYITSISFAALLGALLMLGLKDFSNMLRFRFMSHGAIDLKSAFYVVLLWEFAVAVAPPLLGVTPVLVFILFRQTASFGKALSYAFLAASLDNLFFLTATPIALLVADEGIIPEIPLFPSQPDTKVSYLFWLSYLMIVGYTAFMLFSIVIMPKFINKILVSLTRFKWVSKYKEQILTQGHELLLASKILRGQKIGYWLKLLVFTYVVWGLKYAVFNFVAGGFQSLSFTEHIEVWGKQLTMWVTLLVSPAPGNAGTAEFVFPAFYGALLGQFSFAASMVWRFITYYPYLLVGVVVLPLWMKKSQQ
ncbi:lysylphosphatidylglycerol synthase domain-containing protein [Roseivirga pacifica]|uniref:lysylphosphatidylglycerol synthase domain-containing protein n=1 Tax=Roseivirga pacifica TaxID=1267423 RepID=UPI00227B6A7C|nr:lysylphosphatidylglycerol synthase domain-containing protein [Roseivirga pacifica]